MMPECPATFAVLKISGDWQAAAEAGLPPPQARAALGSQGQTHALIGCESRVRTARSRLSEAAAPGSTLHRGPARSPEGQCADTD